MRVLGRRIGRGSGGEVFRARSWPRGHVVAIKRLTREHRDDDGYVRRLRQEAAMIGALDHDNVVRLLRLDASGEQVELTMEYVDGANLYDLMQAGRLTAPAILHVTRSLLSALAHAHRAGIVHRDISPRNVLVNWDGQVKLSDFGLAKPNGAAPTSNADVRGTLPYASPEQLKGRDADSRSDLFAVGVLLHELVTGERPWNGSTFEIIFELTVAQQALPPVTESCPWVSPELARVITGLLAHNVEERYQSAEDVLIDLADLADAHDGRAELARAMAILGPRRSESKRSTVMWVAAVAMLIGYLAVGGTSQPEQPMGEIPPTIEQPIDVSSRARQADDSIDMSERATATELRTPGEHEQMLKSAQPVMVEKSPRRPAIRRHGRARPRQSTEAQPKRTAFDQARHGNRRGSSLDIPQPVGGTVYAVSEDAP